MVDDVRDDVARLECEVEVLRGEAASSRGRVGVLEGRLRRDAVDAARRRVLAEVAGGRGVGLDVVRASGLLARLTGDVGAVVDEAGEVCVPEDEVARMRESVELMLDGLRVEGGGVCAPPISPGEPPRRVGVRGGVRFANCWCEGRGGGRGVRGRAMIAEAAEALEREGRI